MNRTSWRLRTDDGTELHVEVGGQDAQTVNPVLLINGITMTTEAWNLLARQLPDRTVLRYDMRGQGASDAPKGPYLRERHAHDLLLLLDDLTERGFCPLHVVALSNGGYVVQLLLGWLNSPTLAQAAGLPVSTLDLLARHRKTIGSLTLLDTFIKVDARMRAGVRSWLGALEYGGPAARFDAATPWVWGPDFLEGNVKALADARALAADHPQEAVRSLLEGLMASAAIEPDLKPTLSSLNLPLLVALGEDDVLTPVRSHREVLTAFGRNPDDLHLIPSAGHAAPIENAAACAALINPFLSANDSAQGRGATM